MKRLSPVLKACAVCSSLLLVGGYISYRSGVLNHFRPLDVLSGLGTSDVDPCQIDSESADLPLPELKPLSSSPSLRDRVVMSGSKSIAVIVDESVPAALSFSSSVEPVAVISFTQPSPADSNGQDNSDSEGGQRNRTSQESAASGRKVVMFGSKSGAIDIAPSTLASIAQARLRSSGSLFIETVSTAYDHSGWTIEIVPLKSDQNPSSPIKPQQTGECRLEKPIAETMNRWGAKQASNQDQPPRSLNEEIPQPAKDSGPGETVPSDNIKDEVPVRDEKVQFKEPLVFSGTKVGLMSWSSRPLRLSEAEALTTSPPNNCAVPAVPTIDSSFVEHPPDVATFVAAKTEESADSSRTVVMSGSKSIVFNLLPTYLASVKQTSTALSGFSFAEIAQLPKDKSYPEIEPLILLNEQTGDDASYAMRLQQTSDHQLVTPIFGTMNHWDTNTFSNQRRTSRALNDESPTQVNVTGPSDKGSSDDVNAQDSMRQEKLVMPGSKAFPLMWNRSDPLWQAIIDHHRSHIKHRSAVTSTEHRIDHETAVWISEELMEPPESTLPPMLDTTGFPDESPKVNLVRAVLIDADSTSNSSSGESTTLIGHPYFGLSSYAAVANTGSEMPNPFEARRLGSGISGNAADGAMTASRSDRRLFPNEAPKISFDGPIESPTIMSPTTIESFLPKKKPAAAQPVFITSNVFEGGLEEAPNDRTGGRIRSSRKNFFRAMANWAGSISQPPESLQNSPSTNVSQSSPPEPLPPSPVDEGVGPVDSTAP